MLTKQWARSFIIRPDDIDVIQGLLLERETPLSIDEIARLLIDKRLQEEQAALAAEFRGVRLYRPVETFSIGDRLVFPRLDFAMAEVVELRAGKSPELPPFSVIRVAFDDGTRREFASALTASHRLNDESGDLALRSGEPLTTDAILSVGREDIEFQIDEALNANSDFVRLSGRWFSRALMLDIDDGHLHLADAVLDMAQGGPLTAPEILEQIGGLGAGSQSLQEFCLNDALNNDARFDEVGPLDTVLWFLKRDEPAEVQQTPEILRYVPLPHNESVLSDEQRSLEVDIDDEWSMLDDQELSASELVRLILIYPHRRAGTLPLTARMRGIFPTARRSPRIALRLIDGQDGEEYSGWVVREGRYVYGLSALYRKHKLPVGALVTVRREPDTDKVIVDFQAHRPRSEYVRLIVSKNGQISFEDSKRAIGAEYDDLMILGADDLAFVDGLFQTHQSGRKTLNGILRNLLTELSRANPQGAVHAKTLYSALNVLRRCPPGVMLATLMSEPDFAYVGNHYWRLGSA
ncbi:MAG: hypothetical protein SGJ24_09780 [Chloroflexota bacterium]|nr:hypothetical protein [Chloroflexota bacterium]